METKRTYTEVSKLKTFAERFEYLKLDGQVGSATFGVERFMNQAFYKSPEWQNARRLVAIRDGGNDLGVEGCPIDGRYLIHHMNPITPTDVEERNPDIFNPEYLILVSHGTHNDIHYGDASYKAAMQKPIERKPNDTCPWRK